MISKKYGIRFVNLITALALLACERHSLSMQIPLRCNEFYDDIVISFGPQDGEGMVRLTPDANNFISLGPLDDGIYRLEVIGTINGQDGPALDYTTIFTVPGNQDIDMLSLPTPLRPQSIDISPQGDQFRATFDLPTSCRSEGEIGLYISRDSATVYSNPDTILYFNGSFIPQISFFFDDTLLYAGMRHFNAVGSPIFEVFGAPFKVERTVEQAPEIITILQPGDSAVYDFTEFETFDLGLAVEEGGFYSIAVHDQANSNHTATEVVLDISGYFVEARTKGRRGFARHFRARTGGVIDIEVNVAFGGDLGTCALTFHQIDTASAQSWADSVYFDKNNRTIITKKHFEPGSYTIDVNSDLPGSGMYVFYSLYKKDVWSPHEGIFHEGPTNDEYHVPQQQFQIYEAQDLWFVMSSAYSGEPNTVHFSVE